MEQIILENISKKYISRNETVEALKDITVKINKGEMIGIMGPSGSGKTTLLNILGCLDTATSGCYKLNGKIINETNEDKLAIVRNKNIGFVFQQFALIEGYTVFENLEIPLKYRNNFVKRSYTKGDIKTRITSILKKFGVEDKLYSYPNELSGGQKQRVAIARAMITEPEIIIADEPTGALDQKNGEEVIKLFCDINKEGRTVIIVTHDEKIADYCNRRIKIIDGCIIGTKIQS
ncbi:MAG: ABC transporter ATP-binding protein [Clostridiales bacterium]|nr:ABC transporter ATP-binding protein [Clostridiales bacterium]